MTAPFRPIHRALRVLWLSALFLLAAASDALAIVNTQPLFKDLDGDSGYDLQARSGLDLQRGNTELLVINVALAARARFSNHELLLSGAHDRSAARNEKLSNKSFVHQRYRYGLAPWLQWELYGQLAQDKFRLIESRILGGLGPRFVPLRLKLFEWTLGLSYFYEVERVVHSVDFPEGRTRKTHRANLFSRARLEYKNLTLVQLLYAQPALNDPRNIRVLHQIDAAVPISNHLSLTWTFSQSRDSIAPSDVRPLDLRLIGGIKVDF